MRTVYLGCETRVGTPSWNPIPTLERESNHLERESNIWNPIPTISLTKCLCTYTWEYYLSSIVGPFLAHHWEV